MKPVKEIPKRLRFEIQTFDLDRGSDAVAGTGKVGSLSIRERRIESPV